MPAVTDFNPQSLPAELFDAVLNYLGPKDLALGERICKSWRQFIAEENHWKKQCQWQLNISSHIDPQHYFPTSPSYKETLKLVLSRVFDAGTYRYYLRAEIGPVPRIPEAISLKKWNERDPCDLTKTIGESYVWMYSPQDIEVVADASFPYQLDKPNDTDGEAPRLIPQAKPETKVLKVANTINNVEILFNHPKRGNPSKFSYISQLVHQQHGNKRFPSGWICMRKDVIGRNEDFAQQQTTAQTLRVVLHPLLYRINLNFLIHVSSGKANVYLDRQQPYTYARTSTIVLDEQGNAWPSGCGAGGPSGLIVHADDLDPGSVGVAVALPAEVQGLGT